MLAPASSATPAPHSTIITPMSLLRCAID